MTDEAVITGTFADLKTIKTRSTVQIIIEIPIEAADAALKTLGGYPQPGKEQPVAIARLNASVDFKAKKGSLAQQCGILCGDPRFLKFLGENYGHLDGVKAPTNDFEAAAVVRTVCGVDSRAEFDRDAAAGKRWRDLEAYYQGWKVL